MDELKKLPIGIEDFEQIRKEGFYYIDKTKLIEQILNKWGKANLFTRPRRFGKSLNMSMLRNFFEIGMDSSLFDGLYISQNRELCDRYMGKYPVISISLKGINAATYQDARAQLIKVINREARRYQYLLDSDRISEIDKELFRELMGRMEEDTLSYSLQEMSEVLEKHYKQKVIIFIDEYDVPLAKANEQG